MKKCSRCKQLLPEENFNWKFKTRGVRSHICRECSRLYIREHYKKHPQYYIDKARKWDTELVNKNVGLLLDYLKTHPCIDCGNNNPIVLEFDHRDAKDKEYSVSVMVRRWTWLQVLTEIEKCDVRCANCHRIKTAKQFNWLKLNAPIA